MPLGLNSSMQMLKSSSSCFKYFVIINFARKTNVLMVVDLLAGSCICKWKKLIKAISLGFASQISHGKLIEFFKVFSLKKNKILNVSIRDKYCNSPAGLQLYQKETPTHFPVTSTKVLGNVFL